MGDPYYRYDVPLQRGTVARPSFPGYLSSEAPMVASNHALGSIDSQGMSSNFMRRDITSLRSGPYGSVNMPSNGVLSEPGFDVPLSAASLAADVRGYSAPVEDATLTGQQPCPSDLITERPSSPRNVDRLLDPSGESNVLFVGGLPTDCTRREVGHLFRPFFGYEDIRVIHKEARHSGDRARVLCFVEFVDAKCALTAMDALQGYKFDDKKPDSPVLRIQFAHFPFRPPSDDDDDDARIGIPS